MIRRRGRSRSVRRKSRWEGGFSYLTNLGAPGTGGTVPTIAGSSSASAVWARVPAGAFDTVNGDFVLDDCTVYRMINVGGFLMIPTSTGSLDATVGMGVLAWDGISDTPPVITDVPLPTQNGGADWLWWWVSPAIAASTATTAGVTVQNLFAPQGMVFQKSQRKLSTNTGLLLVVEVYANVSGMAWSYGWSHHARYAVKLP